ncbi:acyltransferase [Nocardia sp. CC201C]|uniref:acyltransferase family protein n=1 Tax=Nocardia sp. CC201C TaxID=3044575 RepID=UPI0024A907D2|nr:acyltransferase [Nocardia sp. CC201C]
MVEGRGVVRGAAMSRGLERDWTIEFARAFAIGVVVVVHWISIRVTMVDGTVRGESALSGRPVWVLSWFIQVMPLFFLAGGFANARIVDRHQSYGAYLGARARRLVTPLLALFAIVVPLGAAVGSVSERAAAVLADIVASPLWFLAIYLVAVMVAPIAVWVHDMAAWVLPVTLLLGALAVDAARFGGDGRWADWNLLLVWLFCHQLGIIYARGTLRRIASGGLVLTAVAGAAVLAVMVLLGPYPPTTLGMADAPVSNLSPPTAAIAVLAAVQLAVLALVDRRVRGRTPAGPVGRGVRAVTEMLMPLYLWHIPVIAVLTAPALALPALLPSDPGTWWALRPLWIIAGAAVLFCVARAAMRWESFCARYAARTAPVPVVVGAATAAAGIFLLWRHGVAPHGVAAWAVCLVVVAAALLGTLRRVGDDTSLTRPEAGTTRQ